MTNEEICVWLKAEAEPKFQKFTSGLIPGTDPIIGVRIPKLRTLAKKIAKEKHLGLIFLPFPVGTPAFGKYAFNAGPAELVNYIAHADYVITDSFHGTLFSILFHKQFFTKVSGTHAGVGSRIHDLLSHYNLSDRIIAEQVNYKDPIDYTVIDSIIKKDRAHSLQVLQNIFL